VQGGALGQGVDYLDDASRLELAIGNIDGVKVYTPPQGR